jgi:hypothetical protein
LAASAGAVDATSPATIPNATTPARRAVVLLIWMFPSTVSPKAVRILETPEPATPPLIE